MRRNTAWLLLGLLVLMPLGVAQPPDGQSGQGNGTAGPDGTPAGNRTDDGRTGTQGGRPGTGGAGQPDDSGQGGSPVFVEDARDGFGARPQDAGDQRPAFTYNASRGAMAIERGDQEVLDAVFDALIEFRDADGDGAYDVGEAVVQRLAVQDLDATIEQPSASQRDAVYALPDGGELRLRFQLQPTGASDGAKFDVVIKGFPYHENGTRVALGVGIGAAGLDAGTVDGMPAVVGQGAGDVPYMSWFPRADVDGQDTAVEATVHVAADGQSSTVYWAYARGDVAHDPLLGLTSISLDRLGDATVFIASLGAGALLLAVGYEARRRYRP